MFFIRIWFIYSEEGNFLNDQIVIGITGSFGSGCTTITEVLQEYYGFKGYSLSDTLRSEWSRTKKEKPVEDALRYELQDFGNELRKKSFSFLAEKTLEKVRKEGNQDKNLVFDSIRNTAEIAFFRANFPNFQVIAVDCAEGDRWERVRKQYEERGRTYADFRMDDER